MSKARDWVREPFTTKNIDDLPVDVGDEDARNKHAQVSRFIQELLGTLDSDPTLSRTAAMLYRYLDEDRTIGQFIVDYGQRANIETAAALRSMDVKIGMLAEADDPASTMLQVGNHVIAYINDLSRRFRPIEEFILRNGGAAPGSDGSPSKARDVEAGVAPKNAAPPNEPKNPLETKLNASASSVAVMGDYVDKPATPSEPSEDTRKPLGPTPGTAVRSGPFDSTPTAKVLRVVATMNKTKARVAYIDDIRRQLEAEGVDLSGLAITFLTSTLGNNCMRFGKNGWWVADMDLPDSVREHKTVLMPRNIRELNEARTTVTRHNRSRKDEPLQIKLRKPATRGGKKNE